MSVDQDHATRDPSAGTGSAPEAKVAQERVLRALGAGSSHPRFAPTRLKWARRLARAPIIFAALVIATYFLNTILDVGLPNITLADVLDIALRLLDAIAAAPFYLLLALAAAVSAALAAAFTIRASLDPEHAENPGSGSGFVSGLAILSLIGCGLCVLAAWAHTALNLEIVLRAILSILLVLPAYVLMAYLDMTADTRSSSGFAKVGTALRWAVISAVALTSMLMLSPFASSLASFAIDRMLAVSQALGLTLLSNILQSVVAQNIEHFF